MYSYIKGELVEKQEGLIVLDNQGIGYNILVSGAVLDNLPSIGQQVKIFTYLYVKEDAYTLFGFLSRGDLKLFQLLLGVSGIGPKGALGILSSLSADELRFAVLGEDVKTISKAPGVGKKTAQRLIIELKDKMNLQEAFEQKMANAGQIPILAAMEGQADEKVKQEAVQALIALGYSNTEALQTVRKVEPKPEDSVDDVLRAALRQLAIM